MEIKDQGKILLTGASGYVGGRLLAALEEAGYDLRCMTRENQCVHADLVPGRRGKHGEAAFASSNLCGGRFCSKLNGWKATG